MARRKSPYPRRGTPSGDMPVGACAVCGKEQMRGDPFRTMLSNEILCEECYKERGSSGAKAEVAGIP